MIAIHDQTRLIHNQQGLLKPSDSFRFNMYQSLMMSDHM